MSQYQATYNIDKLFFFVSDVMLQVVSLSAYPIVILDNEIVHTNSINWDILLLVLFTVLSDSDDVPRHD